MKYPISKTFIKNLNTLNQDAKTIFRRYYLTSDGYIFGTKDEYILGKGSHYGRTTLYLDDFNADIVYLDSKQIYQTIKEHKKEINSITFKDDEIYLSGDDTTYWIGSISDSRHNRGTDVSDWLGTFNANVFLNDNQILSLVQNSKLDIKYENFRTRLTREIIPGLKKSHDVDVCLLDSTEKDLFDLYIRAQRTSMVSIHQYRCIIM